jgi:hypothetical protein
MSQTSDVFVVNNIDESAVIFDDENVFPQKHVIRGRDGIGNIGSHINREGLKRDGMKQLLDLFSH